MNERLASNPVIDSICAMLTPTCRHFTQGSCDKRDCLAEDNRRSMIWPTQFAGCPVYKAVTALRALQSPDETAVRDSWICTRKDGATTETSDVYRLWDLIQQGWAVQRRAPTTWACRCCKDTGMVDGGGGSRVPCSDCDTVKTSDNQS